MALQKVNYEAQSDSYWVNLTPDELKLISAFIYNMRLGQGNKFKNAAFTLMDGIDTGISPEFIQDASEEVQLYVTLEDSEGNIGATIDSPQMVFEVRGDSGDTP